MSLPEKSFNGVVAAIKMISQVEPTSEGTLNEQRARRQKLDETPGYQPIKVMPRADTKERVRIVRKDHEFGAVVDFDDPKCGWSPEHIIAGGFVYESAAAAEAVARSTLG